MTEIFNSIIVGFEWAQDLTLAAGALDPGDALRADFKYDTRDVAPLFSLSSAPDGGITIDGQTVELVVPREKTAMIAIGPWSADWRMIYAELVKLPAEGPEEHLGWRMGVPAELPVTRSAA